MAIVSAKKLPVQKIKDTDILGVFCYFYKQYTYAEARKLPYKRVIQLINIARKEQAIEWYNLTKISGASNSSKIYKNLLEEYKSIINR